MSNAEQHHLAKTSTTRLQSTKSGLLLTFIDSEHTAWHVMHSSYTKRRRRQKVATHDKYMSAIQLGQSKNSYHFLHSVNSQVSTPPKRLSSLSLLAVSLLSLPTLLVLESRLQSENITYVRTWHAVVLNYSLNRHTEHVTR